MTQHIRKLVMGFFVSAFFLVAFNIDSQAQQLNTVWERTTLANDLPEWFEPGFVRGMTYGTVDGNERIYAVNRTDARLEVLNPNNGSEVSLESDFDLSGISGGTYPMNDVEISEDGVIFVGNLAVDASSSPFRLYWWTSEGGSFDDSLTVSVPARLGDKFTVVGSVEDNTAEIWMPAAGSDPGLVYVATTADQGASWDIETITLSGDNTSIPSNADVAPMAVGRDADFYIAGNGSSPKRYTSSGAYVADSQFDGANYTGSRNGLQAFSLDGVDHLAVYTYREDGDNVGNATGRVYVYDISDPTSPSTVGESPLMGADESTYSSIHGEAHVRINSNGTYNVFGLDGVNGFAAYTNAEQEEAANIFFSEYIEGSSNNKALEIYNASDAEVSLGSYQIAQSSNGDGWEYFDGFADGAALASGEVYVLLNSDADENLFDPANADEVLSWPSPLGFNGNDARALIHIDPAYGDTTIIDVFGDPNSDSDWDVAGVAGATGEHTLLRKSSVTSGNTTPLGSFGTDEESSEWIVNEQDDFSNLGEPTPEPQEQGPLAGDYYIPQGSNGQGFATLAEAFAAVNEHGLSGSATLYIAEDLDASGDSLIINRTDLSETASLTIKPDMGVSPTITVTGGPGGDGIWINAANWVTIDGSNEPGGNTRDMTITSADSNFSAMIYNESGDNVTVKNLNLTYTGDVRSGSGIVADVSGSAVENFVVDNNAIGTENGEFTNGIASWGSGTYQSHTIATNNDIYSSRRGITTFYSLDNTFSGNTIRIVNPREDQSWYAGIYLAVDLGVTTVSNNEFLELHVNRTESGTYAAGIVLNAAIEAVNIHNNTFAFSNFSNLGAAEGNSVYGIALNNAAGNSINNIYHNTFRIGSSDESGIHSVFGIEGVTGTGQTWNFTNNIFTVEQDAANAYAFNWPIGDGANLNSDYNNLYVSGSSASIGYFNDAASATLADWQSASGNDLNSSSVEVEFVSETDLRLTGSSIGDNDLAGIPLTSVTTDIDGNERSTTAPYKGAFEGDVALSVDQGIEIGSFTLNAPADDFDLNLTGDASTEVVISWGTATAPDTVTYTWHADSVGGDFSDPLVSIPADSDGLDTTLTLTYQAIDDVVADLGVAEGESIDLIWTVTAQVGDSVQFAEASFDLNIARNLSVSNEVDDQPKEFSLSQNYPNPFNPTSNIQFTVPRATDVKLEVYNINGQLVRTLVNSRMSAGEHTVQFNASDLASGIYIYRIIAGNFVQTKKMTLIK